MYLIYTHHCGVINMLCYESEELALRAYTESLLDPLFGHCLIHCLLNVIIVCALAYLQEELALEAYTEDQEVPGLEPGVREPLSCRHLKAVTLAL